MKVLKFITGQSTRSEDQFSSADQKANVASLALVRWAWNGIPIDAYIVRASLNRWLFSRARGPRGSASTGSATVCCAGRNRLKSVLRLLCKPTHQTDIEGRRRKADFPIRRRPCPTFDYSDFERSHIDREAVLHIGLEQSLVGFVDLLDRDDFDIGGDVVLRRRSRASPASRRCRRWASRRGCGVP